MMLFSYFLASTIFVLSSAFKLCFKNDYKFDCQFEIYDPIQSDFPVKILPVLNPGNQTSFDAPYKGSFRVTGQFVSYPLHEVNASSQPYGTPVDCVMDYKGLICYSTTQSSYCP